MMISDDKSCVETRNNKDKKVKQKRKANERKSKK